MYFAFLSGGATGAKEESKELSQLQTNNEELQTMFDAAANERTLLKADLETSERKLQKSISRQQTLEKKYEQQREKNKKLEQILSELKNEVIKMQMIEDKNVQMANVV